MFFLSNRVMGDVPITLKDYASVAIVTIVDENDAGVCHGEESEEQWCQWRSELFSRKDEEWERVSSDGKEEQNWREIGINCLDHLQKVKVMMLYCGMAIEDISYIPQGVKSLSKSHQGQP